MIYGAIPPGGELFVDLFFVAISRQHPKAHDLFSHEGKGTPTFPQKVDTITHTGQIQENIPELVET